MKITAYTERGTFEGKNLKATKKGMDATIKLLQECASGQHSVLSIETEGGYVVVGAELLKSAVFEIDE